MNPKPSSKPKPRWTEISVEIGPEEGPEAVEAVAALLGRFGEGGAVIETRFAGLRSTAGGPSVRVTAYLPAGRFRDSDRRRLEDELRPLRRIHPVSKIAVRKFGERDWAEAWKKGYNPQKIGRRIVIAPSWKKYKARRGEVRIVIDPGRAFGTGLHPTTRLCLVAIEKYLKPRDRVLDVGAGSGILAIAAARLGSGPVYALEIEPEAAAVARENVAMNGLIDRVEVRVGTPESLSSEIPPSGLIAVNILAYTIIRMIPVLKTKLLPGGCLVTGGILAESSGDVETALRKAGLEVVERLEEEEWVSLVARAPKQPKR